MGRIIVDGQQVSDAIDAAQGIAVSKDAGAATPKRPLIDVTDTGPVVVNVTDDGGGNKVVIEVDSSAALDAAAHAAIDHSSITGSGGGTRFLTASATTAQIQAALNDSSVHTVFLDRGTYTMTGTLTIPTGKALVGMNTMEADTVNGGIATLLRWTSAPFPTRLIDLNGGGRLAFIQVNSIAIDSSTSVAIRVAGSGAATAVLDHVKVYQFGGSTRAHAAFSIECDSARLTHCSALFGNSVGFMISAGRNRAPVLLNNCLAHNNTGSASNHGFEMTSSNAVQLIDCIAYQNGGDGFHLRPGGGLCAVRCEAVFNTGNGFSTGSSSTTYTDMIISCTARSNGQWGFDIDGNAGGGGRFHDNLGTGNTNPGFNNFTAAGSGWLSYDNWSV